MNEIANLTVCILTHILRRKIIIIRSGREIPNWNHPSTNS